ncbi:MAG: transglutaminase-like domain-containing protein [Crenarchaeota archaeon]|nr:transglutaminase-like domain-containing protein [Thermoproteota archaeon]
MQHAKLIIGIVLTVIGVSLVLGFLPGKTKYSQVDQEAASRKARVEYVEKRNYTYFLSQSFLLRNPSNNTVVDLVYMWLPVNSSNQFVRLLETSMEPLYGKSSEDGAAIIVYNVSLRGGETIWLNATLQVTVEKYRLLTENIPWLNYSQVEKNTGGKRYWAVDNQTYVSIAQNIGLDTRDPIEACSSIGKWILARLDYQPTWRRGAEHALISRGGRLIVSGDCEEVADVFVTLARILGIRSRVAHGLYLLEDKDVVTMWIRRTETGYDTSDNWGGHAWPQIYVPQAGWVDVELLEGGTVKIGDFSQYHVKYGFEEKSFLGSTMLYCQAMYLETDFFHFTFRRAES